MTDELAATRIELCSCSISIQGAQPHDAVCQFDFYDGGGLDLAFLSFVEVDSEGSVNITRFGDKIVGVGGFINISQNAKHVIFSGTFTAGGLDVACVDGKLKIVQEGQHKKFVERIECISYSAPFAMQEGRTAIFITERAVLKVVNGALELIEIAPGIDLEKDVVRHMAYRPRIAPDLKLMDKRLFHPALMNLRADMEAKARAGDQQKSAIRRAS